MNLYVFITHQQNINRCYSRIRIMMENLGLSFLVVQGGFLTDGYDKYSKVLSLNCNDKYVGLPEKITKAFSYLISDTRFERYTHFVKCDDDINVIQDFGKIEGDYLGKVQSVEGDRNWHVGKTGTFWDQLPYPGKYKPWCLGGNGYVVSRKALTKILPSHDYLEHIYEDVYIGILMNKAGIPPKDLSIKEYLISPNH